MVPVFLTNDGTHGAELWKSDGTAEGTVMVQDIRYGSRGSDISGVTNVNGTLFFTANDRTHGQELWKSGRILYLFRCKKRPTQSFSARALRLTIFACRSKSIMSDEYDPDINPYMNLAIGVGENEGMFIKAVPYQDDPEIVPMFATTYSATDNSGTGLNPSDLAIQRFVFSDGTVLSLEDILARADGVIGEQSGTEQDDILRGSIVEDDIYGGGGNDKISSLDRSDYVNGEDGDDVISAGSGDDQVYGGGWGSSVSDNDIIAGGHGNDNLSGGAGNDVYCFNRGDGQDQIDNWPGSSTGDVDTLSFGVGITPDDVTGYIDTDGRLILSVQGSDDSVSIDWFYSNNGTVEDDELWGSSADDVIIGGMGNDYVSGGDGNDVYCFNPGDGQDLLDNYPGISNGEVDTLSFGGGITKNDISAYIDSEGSLVLSIQGTNDSVSIGWWFDPRHGYYEYDRLKLSRVQFIDQDGNAQIFDLVGIVSALKDSLIVADADNQVSLFTDETQQFELTGTVEVAGGEKAVLYAQTGNVPTEYLAYPDEGISRVQFIDENGNVRIFDFAGIVHSLKESLSAANAENQVSLFTDQTSDFELTGTVDASGGDYAVAYAQTGDLFAVPTHIQGSSDDDVINGSWVVDTIDAGAGNDYIASGGGDDVIDAGIGADTIIAGDGNDTINAGDGTDIIDAGSGQRHYPRLAGR